MALELYLEDELLDKNRKVAQSSLKTINDLLMMDMERKYGPGTDTQSYKRGYLESLLEFESLYLSAQQRLSENSPKDLAPDIRRAYGMFAASDIMLQSLNDQKNSEFHQSYSASMNPVDVRFDIDDYTAISKPLQSLRERLKRAFNGKDIRPITTLFYTELRNSANNYLYNSSQGAYKEFFQSIELRSRSTSVTGITKSRTPSTEIKPVPQEVYDEHSKKFERPPEEIVLAHKISRNDIIGNEPAKDFVDMTVDHLIKYNIKAGKNPMMEDGGFMQYMLLIGDVGTGKTMTAEYAVSLMQAEGKRRNKDVWTVKMNSFILNSWQNGPVQTFEYQLKQITECNKPCVLFIDEIEQFLPSRVDQGADYKHQIINKFLTLSSQSAFKNNGNYMIIGATNLPDKIDRAAMSRFGKPFICEGARTPEEKAKVLYNRLSDGIKRGYVQIKDWNSIGRAAFDHGLNGRQLRDVAVIVLSGSRTNHYPTNFDELPYDTQVRMVRERHAVINDSYLLRSIIDIGKQKDECAYVKEMYSRNR